MAEGLTALCSRPPRQGRVDSVTSSFGQRLIAVGKVVAVIVILASAAAAQTSGPRAPGPAAEAKPFPAPEDALAAARARLGQSCAGAPSKPFPGFTKIPNFIPIIGNGSFVAPFAWQGTRFAFLLTYPHSDAGDRFDQCIISDFVALPPASQPAQTFLQCSLDKDQSMGFGIRQSGVKGTLYWSVDSKTKRLSRVPLGALGGAAPRCRQPESGE